MLITDLEGGEEVRTGMQFGSVRLAHAAMVVVAIASDQKCAKSSKTDLCFALK